jgi:Domain of unknown function (DUF1905)
VSNGKDFQYPENKRLCYNGAGYFLTVHFCTNVHGTVAMSYQIDMKDFNLTFSAELWMYHGKGAWYFVTLPGEDSEQIKFLSSQKQRGWGSVRVTASIGQTTWETSVFPDTKAGAYLLPVKAEVRKKEQLEAGNIVTVKLKF